MKLSFIILISFFFAAVALLGYTLWGIAVKDKTGVVFINNQQQCEDTDYDNDLFVSIACGGGDCDDADPGVYPTAVEQCDGVDNNCNRIIDEGFRHDKNGMPICGDCANPEPEICGNGIDENCDGYDRLCSLARKAPNVPEPPTLLITNTAHNRITLTWEDNSKNEEGFVIQRKIGVRGTFVDFAVLTAPDFSAYNDFTVGPGQIYYYRVRAYNSFGSSPFSNESVKSTPSLSTSYGGRGNGS